MKPRITKTNKSSSFQILDKEQVFQANSEKKKFVMQAHFAPTNSFYI